MSLEEKETITLTFPEEEENYFVFLKEDLIKEYNHRMLKNPVFTQNKKVPLCLSPFPSNGPFISPMTDQEIQRARYSELNVSDWLTFKNVLKDQTTPAGIIGQIPNVAATVTLAELVKEIGLKGQVYHKTVGGKTYVILKGYAGQRFNLTGTRYLNTHPEIVRLGLSKVTVTDVAKSGFKAGIAIYCTIKAVQAFEMILNDGALKPSFFSEMPAEVTKLAVSTLITAVATGAVALSGLPIAAGIGVALAVGVIAGIALEYIDKKIGFTEKLSDAAQTLWKNMKEWWNKPSQPATTSIADPLFGLMFIGGFNYRYNQQYQNGNVVYTA